MLLCVNFKGVKGTEYSASAKGFTTKNLEYVSDKTVEGASLNKEQYTYSITTETTIFRDKTWPSGNYTMTSSTILKGNEDHII